MTRHWSYPLDLLCRGILIACLLCGCAASGQIRKGEPQVRSADLVLHNGLIVTQDPARPEAQALAVRADRIVAVGSNQEVNRYIRQSTRVIDLAGKLAIPGFIDGHAHLLSLGEAKQTLDLTGAKNWDEIVALVRDKVRKSRLGEWIVGRGWHQEKWDKPPTPNVQGFPTHDLLSAVSPGNPVVLRHASGHASIAQGRDWTSPIRSRCRRATRCGRSRTSWSRRMSPAILPARMLEERGVQGKYQPLRSQ